METIVLAQPGEFLDLDDPEEFEEAKQKIPEFLSSEIRLDLSDCEMNYNVLPGLIDLLILRGLEQNKYVNLQIIIPFELRDEFLLISLFFHSNFFQTNKIKLSDSDSNKQIEAQIKLRLQKTKSKIILLLPNERKLVYG